MELSGLDHKELVFIDSLAYQERAYMQLIREGAKPQDARDVLPLATASTIFYTAFESDWKEVFRKRTTIACHPDMVELMRPLEESLTK